MADITRLGEISLPKLSENMTPEDRRAINNYLMQLRDQTMYMLRNLDESNFSDAMRDKLTAMGLKGDAYFHGHTVGGTNPSLIEALGSTDLNLLVDVGFNKEVAEDCALYWSRKPGSLAKLVDKTDQMNADEIAEMGRKAKKRVAEEYTWDKICGQYEDVFVGK